MLQRKLTRMKTKKAKDQLNREIFTMADTCNLSIDQLYALTSKDRDHYMELYFEMRYLDYLL